MMPIRSGRPVRTVRLLRVLTTLATVALLALPLAGTIRAAHSWTFDLSAPSVVAGASASILATVQNTSDNSGGNDSIGCVVISIPAAFTVDGVNIDSVSSGLVWTVGMSGTGPTLVTAVADSGGDRLEGDPQFESLVIRIDVTAGPAGDHAWSAVNHEHEDCQGRTASTTADLDIVGAPNTAPSATADSATVMHDRTLVVAAPGVLGNDGDPDGDPFTAVKDSDPAHGTVVLDPDGSFTYTPDPAYVGPDSFTYHADDGSAISGTVTVSLTVTNAVPTGVVDSYATLHGIPISRPAASGVLANDSDADGDTITASLVSDVTHGSLSLAADGSFTYTPDLLWVGSDSFTYDVTDGIATAGPITVSLNVTNATPDADDDAYAVVHDGSLSPDAPTGVLANDSDDDGDALTTILVADVANGALTLDADGSFDYTPDPGFVGTDTFTYRATDGIAASGVATVTIDVTDQAPTAADDTYDVVHDGILTVPTGTGVLANDADGDGDPVTAVLVTDVSNGVLTLSPDGSFGYTPDPGYVGTDSFTYQAASALAVSAVATVTIDVTDAAPTAIADAYAVHFDTTLTIDAVSGVLGNDADADGDAVFATLETDVTHGTLALAADGSFTYVPDAGYVGPDGFTYRATDGLVPSAPVAVAIDVQDVAPVAADASASVVHDRVLTVAAPGVLAAASDADGDALAAVIDVGPADGSATVFADGSWAYTPDAGFVGTDTFTYRVWDGALLSAPATITVTVTDAAPIAGDDAASVAHDTSLSVPAPGVLADDTDPDGDAITATLVTDVAAGTLALAADGSYTYTPDPGFVGADTFTYRATDGLLASADAVVTISVTNAAPVALDDAYHTHVNTTLTVPLPGVLANDTDADGDALTVTVLVPPAHGALVLTPNGSLSYVPDTGWLGTDSFLYSASDGVTSDAATVAIQVKNTAPTGGDDAYTTRRGTPLAVAAPGVLGNDADADDDPTTAVLVVTAAHGTLTLLGTGGFTYVPASGFVGADGFTYRVSDGLATSTLVRVRIDVVAPPPEPTPTPEPPAPTTEPSPTPGPTLGPEPTAEPSVTPAPSASPSPSPTPAATTALPKPEPTEPPTSQETDDTFAIGGGGTGGGGSTPIGDAVFGASVALALDGFEWQLPGLLLSVPGLLVIVAIASQVFGGLAWLPFARRKLGAFGMRRAGRVSRA